MSIASKFYKILTTKEHIKNAISNIGIAIEDNTIFEEYPNKILEVNDGKELVANAITDKGIETFLTDTFETMAQNILSISGGGSTPIELGAEIVFNPNTTGESSYTIEEDGIYLLVTSNGGGSGASSNITLPSDRTAMIDVTKTGASNRKIRYVVAQLNKNDIVKLTANYNSSWATCMKTILKLNIPTTITVVDSFMKDDSTYSPTMPTDNSRKYMIFGLACGRRVEYSVDRTSYTDFTPHLTSRMDILTSITCEWGTLSQLVTPTMYGYDGGFVSYIIFDCGENEESTGHDFIDLIELGSITSPQQNTSHDYTFPKENFGDNEQALFISYISTPTGGGNGMANHVINVVGANYKVLLQGTASGTIGVAFGILTNINDDVTLTIDHNMASQHATNTVKIYGF